MNFERVDERFCREYGRRGKRKNVFFLIFKYYEIYNNNIGMEMKG